MKEWSQQQKVEINVFRDVRKQLKEKLAAVKEEELQEKRQQEQYQQ